MSTPLQRAVRRDQGTPGSARRTHVAKTPQSGLTPNNDKAELASNRRKRRSEALRKSLSDAFAGEHQDAAKPTLSTEALNNMFERCIKLAAENKITDKNVWDLNLIQHLPSIVLAGQQASKSAFNFQKISGGLDAGVTIYSKRVDHTYKEAFQTLQGKGPSKDAGEEDASCEDDGEEDVEDAAGAAAKQAKQQAAAAKRSKQGAAREEATLATAEQLKQKKIDTTFAVDPLFHKMSALFDEGGAKGLLLLNRSVYRGASIMTNPHDIPDQHFPLQSAAQTDVLIDLKPLKQQLAACQAHSTTAAAGANSLTLTPDLHKLYELLKQSEHRRPAQQQQSGSSSSSSVDVAAVMAQATRGLPPTPMPSSHLSSSAAANHAAAEASSPGNMEWQGTDSQQQPDGPESAGHSSAAEPQIVAGSSAMEDFLAEAATAGPEDEPAAAYDEDGETFDGDGHPGYEDEGATAGAGDQSSDRRQSLSMLGLGGSRDDGEAEVLDAEALQDLLGGGSSGRAASKYKAKAAAIARMGGAAATAKKAAATTGRGKRKAPLRLDFNNIPELPEFVKGTRKQICLAKTASKTASKQKPQEQQYQVANLACLSLRPTAISALRLLKSSRNKSAAKSAAEDSNEIFQGSGDGGAGWGGDGYEDDGDYSTAAAGAEGYNAGDLSMGDPGCSAAAGYGSDDEGAGDWWNTDSELLKALKRAAGLGVNYNHSAKQVDMRALKDLLWGSLITVNQLSVEDQSQQDSPEAAAEAAAAAGPTIPFQEVIVSVPEQSDAGELSDVSVHMCFICLLHLANEKGLVITAQEDLKTLTISNVQAA